MRFLERLVQAVSLIGSLVYSNDAGNPAGSAAPLPSGAPGQHPFGPLFSAPAADGPAFVAECVKRAKKDPKVALSKGVTGLPEIARQGRVAILEQFLHPPGFVSSRHNLLPQIEVNATGSSVVRVYCQDLNQLLRMRYCLSVALAFVPLAEAGVFLTALDEYAAMLTGRWAVDSLCYDDVTAASGYQGSCLLHFLICCQTTNFFGLGAWDDLELAEMFTYFATARQPLDSVVDEVIAREMALVYFKNTKVSQRCRSAEFEVYLEKRRENSAGKEAAISHALMDMLLADLSARNKDDWEDLEDTSVPAMMIGLISAGKISSKYHNAGGVLTWLSDLSETLSRRKWEILEMDNLDAQEACLAYLSGRLGCYAQALQKMDHLRLMENDQNRADFSSIVLQALTDLSRMDQIYLQAIQSSSRRSEDNLLAFNPAATGHFKRLHLKTGQIITSYRKIVASWESSGAIFETFQKLQSDYYSRRPIAASNNAISSLKGAAPFNGNGLAEALVSFRASLFARREPFSKTKFVYDFNRLIEHELGMADFVRRTRRGGFLVAGVLRAMRSEMSQSHHVPFSTLHTLPFGKLLRFVVSQHNASKAPWATEFVELFASAFERFIKI